MKFLHNVSPLGAAKDFAHVWTDNPNRWRVLALSIALTGGFMIVAIPDSQRIPPRKPEVTLITSFAEGRTDAQIEASNIANQVEQDEFRVVLADYEERRKETWRQLGRATGVDVDKMEREIEQERAAEAAALQKIRDAQAARARLAAE